MHEPDRNPPSDWSLTFDVPQRERYEAVMQPTRRTGMLTKLASYGHASINVAVLIGLLGYLLTFVDDVARKSRIVAIAGAVVVIVAIAVLVMAVLVPAFKEKFTVWGTLRLTITEKGVSAVYRNAISPERPWSQLVSARREPSGVLLKYVDGCSHWIPERVFPSPADRQRFFDFVDAQVRAPAPPPRGELEPTSRRVMIGANAWDAEIVVEDNESTLLLRDVADPRSRMAVDFNRVVVIADLSDEEIVALARNPHRRRWADEEDVEWRLAFPRYGVASAEPERWPPGMAEPAPIRITRSGAEGSEEEPLPWVALGHVPHEHLLRWFRAVRATSEPVASELPISDLVTPREMPREPS